MMKRTAGPGRDEREESARVTLAFCNQRHQYETHPSLQTKHTHDSHSIGLRYYRKRTFPSFSFILSLPGLDVPINHNGEEENGWKSLGLVPHVCFSYFERKERKEQLCKIEREIVSILELLTGGSIIQSGSHPGIPQCVSNNPFWLPSSDLN